MAAGSTYRCFLFADLRGYTAYIEQAGNAAGVELVNAYLAIMRREVARHEGAEIKVEGDGFHAVFPSASGAVTCGMAIVEAAAKANAERPDRPINVGVGIHAGEAVETADGFIGSAVNIAARVCGAAAAGEVLVTSTVRGITHASIPVGFASRGRRRLKGIAEPIELFAAVPEGATAEPQPLDRRWWLAGAAGAAAVVIGVVAIAVLTQPPSIPAMGSPTPGPSTLPLAIGHLNLGQYAADQFEPPFRFVISDPGWSLYRNANAALGLLRDEEPNGWLDIGVVTGVHTNPCMTEGGVVPAGSTAADLVSILREVPFVEIAGEPTAVDVGGKSGLSLDLAVIEGAQAACGSFGGAGVPLLAAGEEVWDAQPGERVRLVVVDADGTAVTLMQSIEAPPAGSVEALERFKRLADRVVQSIEF